MDNYIRVMINRMARLTGVILTDRHLEILDYTYHYYEKNRVGPLFYNLKKKLGASKEEINKIFPHGLNSIYTWVGIPIQTPDKSCEPIVKIHVDHKESVYLDHNATTYVRPEVSKVLCKYFNGTEGFANPSSSTIQGKQAYDHVHIARKKVARCLHASPDEIIFTGCGSEANNLAIKGVAFKFLKTRGHIITTKIEHACVLQSVEWLESIGFEATYLDVNSEGVISLDDLKRAIRENTILVSIMAVNNEIGTIQPLEEIGKYLQSMGIPFVVDGVQAFGKIDLRPGDWGISALAFSGHKIYAPKGIGGLYLSHDLIIDPIIHGGGQEFGIRSGTENVGYVMAIGEAARLAYNEIPRETKRILQLRDYFLKRLKDIEPDFVINGSLEKRVPWNLSIGFPSVDTGALLLSLNSIGVCVSAGSACSSGKIKTSHVIEALKADTENYGTIRFSFGLRTTKEGLDYLFSYLPEILKQLKKK